ncbi:DNA-binding protein [Deinococcus sp. KSM4-11]|uniref:DNA-binding protein n=1 Tax=Deinococcus sp. KSM4-11 TaxID=2568654 RepID=UPI0010A303E7|nr:DNA-binding protein [Deinococcus sp. KSM4-11]THF88414.1 DNA-binding protein [Deinococcus sp. KSM4-11]
MTLTIPPAVRDAAQQGLILRRHLGYGGNRTGERVAERLLSDKPLTASRVRWMATYFATHPQPPLVGSTGNPHRMYVGWLLMGGDAGRAWAECTLMALNREEACKQAKRAQRRAAAPVKQAC